MSEKVECGDPRVDAGTLKSGQAYSIRFEDCCGGVVINRAVFIEYEDESEDLIFDVVELHNVFGKDGGFGRYEIEEVT